MLNALSPINPIRSKLDARVYVLSLFSRKVDEPNFKDALMQAEEYLLNGIELPSVTKDEFAGMSDLIGHMTNKIDSMAINEMPMCEGD